jgi:RNA polymerase sigma factor (sigma-70 family)
MLLRDEADLTDGQLLECFIEHRDDAAFAALVRRHGPMVWGVCRRLLHQHDAEDAFQATFLVLVRKAASIVSRERVANWLYGVAHQTALQARRTAARRRARETQVTNMPEPAVMEQDLWSDLQPLLDQELRRLPDAYREVIVLCALEGKTRKEVAQQLGLPEGTVGSRLARARTMLAKRLARHGLPLLGGTMATVLSQNVASAGVPSWVMSSTIKAASLFAAGQAAAGVISVRVAALTEGVLKTMLLTKLKIVTVVVLMIALLTGGAGLIYQTQAEGQENDPKAAAHRKTAQEKGGAALRVRATFKVIDEGDVTSVAFSPDGKTVVAGAAPDNTPVPRKGLVKVWDVATGKQLPLFKDKDFLEITSVVYSPDGKTLAIGERDASRLAKPPERVTLWEVATGKKIDTLKGCGPLQFSPDGKALAAAESDHTVRVWEVGSRKELATLKGHKGLISSVVYAPDGKVIATSSNDRYVRLWDAATGNVLHTVKQGKYLATSVVFSPDGKTLASVGMEAAAGRPGTARLGGGVITLCNTQSGKIVQQWEDKDSGLLAVAFSPDGKTVATGGYDRMVKLWDVTSKQQLTSLKGHTKYVRALTFAPNGRSLASGSWDGTVKIWEVIGLRRSDWAR